MRHLLILTLVGLLVACEQGNDTKTSLIEYVDPFIGTAGKGKTYPGASVPFGMVQLSPDNGRNGWDWISGYYYPDSVIAGFSHTHLSGTGAGDLYDISFMPTMGVKESSKLDDINSSETIFSKFSHEEEEASPGYYRVLLEDYQITVELTATTRSGLQRYTPLESGNLAVKLDLGYTRNWDKVTASELKIIDNKTVAGVRKSAGWAKDQQVFFYSVFSRPFDRAQLFSEDQEVEGGEAEGLDIASQFFFTLESGEPVLVKTGISSTSVENAKNNLISEQSEFDFEGTRKKAEMLWESQLDKIKIEAAPDNKVQFYTALYHSMLAPITFSDVSGEYHGPDGQVHKADYTRYSIFSLWDTFRALHPLSTIIHTDRVPDMINSLLGHYEEYGKLPVWEMHGNETDMMLGYHAVPVIADAVNKEIKGFDVAKAYEAAKASAMQEEFQVDSYKKLGYVPYETRNWNVSLTMEYAYDDWCIAQLSKTLGNEDEEAYFQSRALNYRKHFDEETKFMRAKNASGSFREPFDPLAYHPEDYAEANAWQYLWFAPQDIPGLIELMGGKSTFESRLDSMFEITQAQGEDPVWISGYIGQYVHGNEPSHHVPYLYQFVDNPGKTQQRVRQIMDELYTTDPGGLCGNEDCGQMSAWYIFSALGFYPVNPADGKYVFGSPEVEEATITLPNGKKFKIRAINQSQENIYIEEITLNGKPVEEHFITHRQIMDGGELIFKMTNQLNKEIE